MSDDIDILSSGYLLPTPITGYDLICVTLKIPDVQEYRAAFRGAIKRLTEWHSWQRTGDTKGSQAATYWRQIINDHLIIQDCNELELFGGDELAQFKMCWFQTEDGAILRYTLNDGCTWNDVLNCDGSIPGTDNGEPQVPTIDPIDQPGTYPQPDLVLGNRCRVVNATFFNLFNLALTFFSSVLALETATERANALRIFLDATDEDGSGLQWYTPFSLFIQKYLPFITNIGNSVSSSTWEDLLECIVLGCYPVLTDVTRDILECIADGLDSEADALSPTDDRGAYYKYIADFFRIYPLSQIRANAFRDAINTEVSSVCTDCGGGGGGGCDDLLITFDAGSPDFTIQVGAEGIGKNGIGVKGIDVSAGTFGSSAGMVKENALKVVIPLPEVCLVKGVFWQYQIKIANPTPNANVYITPPIVLKTYSLEATTSVVQPKFKEYYYNWATKWSRIGYLYPDAVYADRVEILIYFETKYSARVITNVLDEIEIIMG